MNCIYRNDSNKRPGAYLFHAHETPGAYSGIYGNWKIFSGHTLKVPSLYQLGLSFSIDKSSQLQKVRVYLYHPLQNQIARNPHHSTHENVYK